MATTLVYSNPNFIPLTVIKSADVNAKFTDIKSRLNWDGSTATTGLGDDNIQSNTVSGGGLTRATKLKAGTANYVLINGSDGKMSEEAQLATTRGGLGFNPTLSSTTAGKVVGVNDAGNALELRTAEAGVLVEQLAQNVVTLTAGEAISSRDAVCLALNNGSYKVFKADADATDRNLNFLGFALASATVTPQIVTIAISPAAWSSGTATISVNGRNYSQAYSSSHNTSVDALASLINADPEVNSCSASGTTRNLITITSKGALSITVTVVAQPTGATFGTPTTTQTAVGDPVRIQCFGPLSGFSSLSVASLYYLSTTAGSITEAQPSATASFVGQAISSDVLFVSPNRFNFSFAQSLLFIKSHGSSAANPPQVTQDVEHFNFATWSSGTASTAGSRFRFSHGDSAYGGYHYQVDGVDSAGNVTALNQRYNKSSWSTLTNRGTALERCAMYAFNNYLYVSHGFDGSSNVSTASKFNGTSWSSISSFGTAKSQPGSYTVSSLLHIAGGNNTSAHDTLNTSDSASTATAYPLGGGTNSMSNTSNLTGGKGYSGAYSVTDSYVWDGSSWSSNIAMPYVVSTNSTLAAACAYNSTSSIAYFSGGYDGSNARTNTSSFNGTSYTTTTAASNARTSPTGSII